MKPNVMATPVKPPSAQPQPQLPPKGLSSPAYMRSKLHTSEAAPLDMKPNVPMTPVKPPSVQPQPQPKILSSVPVHMRSEFHTFGASHHVATPAMKGNAPPHTGLNTPITTPAHGSTSLTSRQSIPAAPPQAPPERKVSLAQSTTTVDKPTTSSTVSINKASPPSPAPAPAPASPAEKTSLEADPDDSYHFCSDDDALFALVDLGEGDLGQPVLEAADLGRPIDDDDDEGDARTPIHWGEGSGVEDTLLEEASDGNAQDNWPPGINSKATVGKRQDMQRVQATSEGASNLGMLSKLLPQNQSASNNSNRPPSHAVNQPSWNSAQPRLHQIQNQAQYRHQNNLPPQNQNKPSQIGNASGSSSTVKRPLTPLMGGFHFPPEIVSSRIHFPPLVA